MSPPPKGSSRDQIAGALALVEAAMAPADDATLEAALAELSVQVNCYGTDGAKADLQLAVYRRSLQRFPADIALTALRMWPEVPKPTGRGKDLAREWPTWPDLKNELEGSAYLMRVNMAAALRGALAKIDEQKKLAS